MGIRRLAPLLADLCLGALAGVPALAAQNAANPAAHRSAPDAVQAAAGQVAPVTAPATRKRMVPRTSLQFESRKGPQGATYVIGAATYADGSSHRALSSIWLPTTIPLEIVLLDDVIPPEQKNQTPQPQIRDDFPEKTWVQIDMTGGEVDSDEALRDPSAMKLPACEQGAWRALARLSAPEMRVQRLRLDAQPEVTQQLEPVSLPRGIFVCLTPKR